MSEFFKGNKDTSLVKFIGGLKKGIDKNEILSVGRYYHKE